MKEYKCDALIVGAGPAGSSAAFSASKEGLKVLLIDRKPVPCPALHHLDFAIKKSISSIGNHQRKLNIED